MSTRNSRRASSNSNVSSLPVVPEHDSTQPPTPATGGVASLAADNSSVTTPAQTSNSNKQAMSNPLVFELEDPTLAAMVAEEGGLDINSVESSSPEPGSATSSYLKPIDVRQGRRKKKNRPWAQKVSVSTETGGGAGSGSDREQSGGGSSHVSPVSPGASRILGARSPQKSPAAAPSSPGLERTPKGSSNNLKSVGGGRKSRGKSSHAPKLSVATTMALVIGALLLVNSASLFIPPFILSILQTESSIVTHQALVQNSVVTRLNGYLFQSASVAQSSSSNIYYSVNRGLLNNNTVDETFGVGWMGVACSVLMHTYGFDTIKIGSLDGQLAGCRRPLIQNYNGPKTLQPLAAFWKNDSVLDNTSLANYSVSSDGSLRVQFPSLGREANSYNHLDATNAPEWMVEGLQAYQGKVMSDYIDPLTLSYRHVGFWGNSRNLKGSSYYESDGGVTASFLMPLFAPMNGTRPAASDEPLHGIISFDLDTSLLSVVLNGLDEENSDVVVFNENDGFVFVSNLPAVSEAMTEANTRGEGLDIKNVPSTLIQALFSEYNLDPLAPLDTFSPSYADTVSSSLAPYATRSETFGPRHDQKRVYQAKLSSIHGFRVLIATEDTRYHGNLWIIYIFLIILFCVILVTFPLLGLCATRILVSTPLQHLNERMKQLNALNPDPQVDASTDAGQNGGKNPNTSNVQQDLNDKKKFSGFREIWNLQNSMATSLALLVEINAFIPHAALTRIRSTGSLGAGTATHSTQGGQSSTGKGGATESEHESDLESIDSETSDADYENTVRAAIEAPSVMAVKGASDVVVYPSLASLHSVSSSIASSNLVTPNRSQPQTVAASMPSSTATVAMTVNGTGSSALNTPKTQGSSNPLLTPNLGIGANSTSGHHYTPTPSTLVRSLTRNSVSILVINIQNFNMITLKPNERDIAYTHSRIVDMVVRSVQAHRGHVDYFYGDHFVASFNALSPVVSHKKQSILCALNLKALVEQLDKELTTTQSNIGQGAGASTSDTSSFTNSTGLAGGGGGGGAFVSSQGASSTGTGSTIAPVSNKQPPVLLDPVDQQQQQVNSNIKLSVSCGAASGKAVVGNMGTDSMIRFCCVGDVVSHAFQLERACNTATKALQDLPVPVPVDLGSFPHPCPQQPYNKFNIFALDSIIPDICSDVYYQCVEMITLLPQTKRVHTNVTNTFTSATHESLNTAMSFSMKNFSRGGGTVVAAGGGAPSTAAASLSDSIAISSDAMNNPSTLGDARPSFALSAMTQQQVGCAPGAGGHNNSNTTTCSSTRSMMKLRDSIVISPMELIVVQDQQPQPGAVSNGALPFSGGAIMGGPSGGGGAGGGASMLSSGPGGNIGNEEWMYKLAQREALDPYQHLNKAFVEGLFGSTKEALSLLDKQAGANDMYSVRKLRQYIKFRQDRRKAGAVSHQTLPPAGH